MPYHHLTESHRRLIEDLHRAGNSNRAIGQRMGRCHTTIGRELKRHSQNGVYDSQLAESRAQERLHHPRRRPRLEKPELLQAVTEGLERDWSPEIISAQLRQQHPDDPSWHLSHESIYQWIYREAEKGGTHSRSLWRPRPARLRRHSRKPAYSRIPDRVDIDQRPPEVAERTRVGDWEGDSVVNPKNRGGIATFVERTTRFLIAGHLPDKQASTFAQAATELFSWVPDSLCLTVTLDNGTEMAAHADFSQDKTMNVYFAHPHSPWQRGANEQVNGLIRHFFPKGTDFSKVSPAELEAVVLKINQRPRKCLNYRAPYDVFADALRGALVT